MWIYCKVKSAQKSDVYIIWFHVPAGFAHTDDMKLGLYRYLYIYIYTIFMFVLSEASQRVLQEWVLQRVQDNS